MVIVDVLWVYGGGDVEFCGDGVSRRGRRRAFEIETSLSAYVVCLIFILYCLYIYINIIIKVCD